MTDKEENVLSNLFGINTRKESIDDYKRIKKAIKEQNQDELEELIEFENVKYNIVQVIEDNAPYMGSSFYANFVEPKLLSSGFISDVLKWNNDAQKADFVNELMKHRIIRKDPNYYYKITTIAASIKNKVADKRLSKNMLNAGLYKFKRELFSMYKNKPNNLESLMYAMQGNDYGRMYSIFDGWKDARKEKVLQTLEPNLREFDNEKYKDANIEDVPVDELYDIEINATLSLLASTIKDEVIRAGVPEIIENNPYYKIRTAINNGIGKKNEEELYYINKYLGSDVNILQVIQSFRLCSSDKNKIKIINELPDCKRPEYKQIALVIASTLEKEKSKEKLPDELKEESQYKMIDLLNKKIDSLKVDKYTFAKIMRDVITKNLDVHSANNFKHWNDDKVKLEVINELLKLDKEMPEDMHDFVGEFSTDIIQSMQDKKIKAKVPEKSDNEKYNKYFEYNKRFKKLEDDLKEVSNEKNNDDKDSRIGIDKRIHFGIEIESEGPNSLYLLNEGKIRTNGDKVTPQVWKTETDQTLENGVEVVSPILIDRQKDVKSIDLINDALKDMGQKTSERCGAHVHIGADYIKSRHSFINLVEIYSNCEEILYLISNPKGEIPRHTLKEMIDAINPKLNVALSQDMIKEKDLDSIVNFSKKIVDIQVKRNMGLNFLNVGNKEKNTYEFRLSNGTVDKDVWKDNIRLYGKLMEVSEKIGKAEDRYYKYDDELTEEELRLINLEDKLKDEELDIVKRKDILLDMLFGDDEKRQIYEERFDANYKLYQEKEADVNPLKTIKFKPIDIKKLLNVKNAIIKSGRINYKQAEQDMMQDLEEMEQDKNKERNVKELRDDR